MKAMFPLALAALLGACDAAPDAASRDADLASARTAALPPVRPAAPPVKRLPSDRIYYDLTRFEWYARGEPLRHEGLGYQPAGMPLAISLEEMEPAGAYQGVDYYRRHGSDGLLFVPVFDGYWLVFRSAAPPPVPAD